MSSLALSQEPSVASSSPLFQTLRLILFSFFQNNLISKVPRGALSRQTHLRELYLQHNLLTDSGLDATTFRWVWQQGWKGVMVAALW
jgi:hypothetical protein